MNTACQVIRQTKTPSFFHQNFYNPPNQTLRIRKNLQNDHDRNLFWLSIAQINPKKFMCTLFHRSEIAKTPPRLLHCPPAKPHTGGKILREVGGTLSLDTSLPPNLRGSAQNFFAPVSPRSIPPQSTHDLFHLSQLDFCSGTLAQSRFGTCGKPFGHVPAYLDLDALRLGCRLWRLLHAELSASSQSPQQGPVGSEDRGRQGSNCDQAPPHRETTSNSGSLPRQGGSGGDRICISRRAGVEPVRNP